MKTKTYRSIAGMLKGLAAQEFDPKAVTVQVDNDQVSFMAGGTAAEYYEDAKDLISADVEPGALIHALLRHIGFKNVEDA